VSKLKGNHGEEVFVVSQQRKGGSIYNDAPQLSVPELQSRPARPQSRRHLALTEG